MISGQFYFMTVDNICDFPGVAAHRVGNPQVYEITYISYTIHDISYVMTSLTFDTSFNSFFL